VRAVLGGAAGEEEGMIKGFHAHEVTLAWASALGPALARVAKGDADLARQLRRAVASVPLNLAEGSRRAGKDRIHHYRVAAGSAEEAMSALALALAWRHLEAGDVAASEGFADRLRAMLWRLTHARE
jgi:four helix bundle protein